MYVHCITHTPRNNISTNMQITLYKHDITDVNVTGKFIVLFLSNFEFFSTIFMNNNFTKEKENVFAGT